MVLQSLIDQHIFNNSTVPGWPVKNSLNGWKARLKCRVKQKWRIRKDITRLGIIISTTTSSTTADPSWDHEWPPGGAFVSRVMFSHTFISEPNEMEVGQDIINFYRLQPHMLHQWYIQAPCVLLDQWYIIIKLPCKQAEKSCFLTLFMGTSHRCLVACHWPEYLLHANPVCVWKW